MMHISGVLFGQVSMPSAQAPGPGDFLGGIMRPIGPWLSTAWWYGETFFIPLCIIIGLIGVCLAAISGHKAWMMRSRGVLYTVAGGVLTAGIVLAFVNWVLVNYGMVPKPG